MIGGIQSSEQFLEQLLPVGRLWRIGRLKYRIFRKARPNHQGRTADRTVVPESARKLFESWEIRQAGEIKRHLALFLANASGIFTIFEGIRFTGNVRRSWLTRQMTPRSRLHQVSESNSPLCRWRRALIRDRTPGCHAGAAGRPIRLAEATGRTTPWFGQRIRTASFCRCVCAPDRYWQRPASALDSPNEHGEPGLVAHDRNVTFARSDIF